MDIDMIVLAKSAKYGAYCVAGIRTDNLKYIRIVGDTLDNGAASGLTTKQITLESGTPIQLLDVVKAKNIIPAPHGIQIENFHIQESFIFEKTGQKSVEDLYSIYLAGSLEKKLVLGSTGYKVDNRGMIRSSLQLCLCENVKTYQNYAGAEGFPKTKISFSFMGNPYSNLSMTDQRFIENLSEIGRSFILFSFPEDKWSQEKGYFKYASSIIPF